MFDNIKIAAGGIFDPDKPYTFTDGWSDFYISPPYMVGVDESGHWWVEEGISGVRATQLWEVGKEPWNKHDS